MFLEIEFLYSKSNFTKMSDLKGQCHEIFNNYRCFSLIIFFRAPHYLASLPMVLTLPEASWLSVLLILYLQQLYRRCQRHQLSHLSQDYIWSRQTPPVSTTPATNFHRCLIVSKRIMKKTSVWTFFPYTGVDYTCGTGIPWAANIFLNCSNKFEIAIIVHYNEGPWEIFHEKPESKISWHCPFKEITKYRNLLTHWTKFNTVNSYLLALAVEGKTAASKPTASNSLTPCILAANKFKNVQETCHK